jgi:hypothetical protein
MVPGLSSPALPAGLDVSLAGIDALQLLRGASRWHTTEVKK